MQTVSDKLRRQIRDANEPPSRKQPKCGATILPFPIKSQCGLRRFVRKALSDSYQMTEREAFVHFQKCAADYVEYQLAIGVERDRVDAELRDVLATINATFTREITAGDVEMLMAGRRR
jgi:hypothetical protein